jgi:hypothetical protein
MSEYKLPDEEEMSFLQGWIVESFKDFANLETLIICDAHIHEIYHSLKILINDLNGATERAEKFMEELGYEHD